MAAGLHVSLSAEPISQLGGFIVTNSMFTSLIVSGLLITFALFLSTKIKNTSHPTGWQNFAEWIVEAIYNLIYSVTHSHKKTAHFFPLLATFLLFILLNNWFGLVPGVGTIGYQHEVKDKGHAAAPTMVPTAHAATEVTIDEAVTIDEEHSPIGTQEVYTEEKPYTVFVPYLRAGTADLNTTLALAIISVFATQVIGFQYLSLGYFGKFINFSSPIMFFVGLLEIISEFAKIVSFAFRLFGNIFAGEVLLAVISFLVPLVVPMPFYGLEVFVGFIQALVFTLLSLVFFNMATESHEAH